MLEKDELIALMAATIYANKPMSRRREFYAVTELNAMLDAAREAELIWSLIIKREHKNHPLIKKTEGKDG